MTSKPLLVGCIAALVIAAGCGSGRVNPAPGGSARAPDVTRLRLDAAERELGDRGLEYYVYADDEVIIRTNWVVCSQTPEPGKPATEVDLHVEHFSCDGDDDD